MKLLITWMVCIWASNDMKVNCIVEESKIRWISRKKKRKMDLLIACSYMEVWVNFLSVSGHSGLFHGLYSIIRKLYVFLSKPWIEFFFSGLFLIEAEFFLGLDWSWVVNLSNSSFVTTKHFIILLEIWMLTLL